MDPYKLAEQYLGKLFPYSVPEYLGELCKDFYVRRGPTDVNKFDPEKPYYYKGRIKLLQRLLQVFWVSVIDGQSREREPLLLKRRGLLRLW